MRPPVRWPLHPAPIDGEALSSWLLRIALDYNLNVAELIEHGLGHDPSIETELDIDPPASLLVLVAERTGVPPSEIREMCFAGFTPWLFDNVQPDGSDFDTYVRQFSVLLRPETRSKRQVRRWQAWGSAEPIERACAGCLADRERRGRQLFWRLPLTLSCPEHGLILQQCSGSRGNHFIWPDPNEEPIPASDPVLAMDRRTEQARSDGHVDLPAHRVHAGVWFRLLRGIVDEVSTPITYWGTRASDLRRIYESCEHPVRAEQTGWRPYEEFPWSVQAQLLKAAAHAIGLVEDGTVQGRGEHATLLYPVYDPVDAGTPPDRPHVTASRGVTAAIEEATQAARQDPAEAQALYNLLVYGCRTVEAETELLRTFDALGIPTLALSRNFRRSAVHVT